MIACVAATIRNGTAINGNTFMFDWRATEEVDAEYMLFSTGARLSGTIEYKKNKARVNHHQI